MRQSVIVACLVLAACATPQERAERDLWQAKWACADLGYQPETEGWRQCTVQLYQQNRANRGARETAASLQLMQQSLQILSTPPPAPTMTSCRWFAGNYVCQ